MSSGRFVLSVQWYATWNWPLWLEFSKWSLIFRMYSLHAPHLYTLAVSMFGTEVKLIKAIKKKCGITRKRGARIIYFKSPVYDRSEISRKGTDKIATRLYRHTNHSKTSAPPNHAPADRSPRRIFRTPPPNPNYFQASSCIHLDSIKTAELIVINRSSLDL